MSGVSKTGTRNEENWVVILIVVLLAVVFLGPLSFMGGFGMMGGMMGPGMMGWGGSGPFSYNPVWALLGVLIPLAFLGAIVVGAYYLLSRRTPSLQAGRATPLEIIKERYAKGEITPEQYKNMKQDLES